MPINAWLNTVCRAPFQPCVCRFQLAHCYPFRKRVVKFDYFAKKQETSLALNQIVGTRHWFYSTHAAAESHAFYKAISLIRSLWSKTQLLNQTSWLPTRTMPAFCVWEWCQWRILNDSSHWRIIWKLAQERKNSIKLCCWSSLLVLPRE